MILGLSDKIQCKEVCEESQLLSLKFMILNNGVNKASVASMNELLAKI